MDLHDAIMLIFWLGVGLLAVGLLRRARLWQRGQPAEVSLAGLLSIPRRYFRDLHDVVAREPAVARAHVAVAGGAVACLALVGVNEGLRLRWLLLDILLVLAAVAMLGGALAMARRRRKADIRQRLSGGPWDRLPWTLGVGALGLVALGALGLGGTGELMAVPSSLATGIALIVALAVLVGAAELALGIGLAGPMKHAVAGLLHLGFHPRPARFFTGPEPVGPGSVRPFTSLRPMDLNQRDHGQGRVADFAWNRLLSFDACVQCGKCQDACPAFAAGQPLNPKKLIQDLVAAMSSGDGSNYRGKPHPGVDLGLHGSPDDPLVPGTIRAETLWSCTTCRACVHACPMMIEHVDAVVGMRRHLSLVGGDVPGKGLDVLAALRDTDTQSRQPLHERYQWATDLPLRALKPGQSTQWLLIAGESAFDLRAQRTLRILVKTLARAGITLSVLGGTGPDEGETDTGDVARRLGDEATFQTLASRLMTRIAAVRPPGQTLNIVTADPHVLHALRNEYPVLDARFGENLKVWHHSELLAELLASGALLPDAGQPIRTGRNAPKVTYHDPCYLGRYNGQVEAPRQALGRIGIEIIEMGRHGRSSRCCGGGGGAPLTDIPGERRIPDIRIEDARATGATLVAVACPQCAVMLEGVSGPRPQVLDVAEIVGEALGVAP